MSDSETRNVPPSVDAVIVGAGFSGLYLLHRLREQNRTAVVFEAGTDVGGTWYWNRYPGARVDVESLAYSYSFSDELEQEYEWKERYPTQPEILKYAQHVADRFDLRRDIVFRTRAAGATWDEPSRTWSVRTEHGDAVTARFLVMATGCRSSSKMPEIAGLESFKGDRAAHPPGQLPRGRDVRGRRGAVQAHLGPARRRPEAFRGLTCSHAVAASCRHRVALPRRPATGPLPIRAPQGGSPYPTCGHRRSAVRRSLQRSCGGV
ncbi:flavin-containing monooxygenase [Micromonosporaceae bacterium Da 78-11]